MENQKHYDYISQKERVLSKKEKSFRKKHKITPVQEATQIMRFGDAYLKELLAIIGSGK